MSHSERKLANNTGYTTLYKTHNVKWKEQLALIQSRIDLVEPVVVEGRLNRMVGLMPGRYWLSLFS